MFLEVLAVMLLIYVLSGLAIQKIENDYFARNDGMPGAAKWFPIANVLVLFIAIALAYKERTTLPKYLRRTIATMLKEKDYEIHLDGVRNKALNIAISPNIVQTQHDRFQNTTYAGAIKRAMPVIEKEDKYKPLYEMYVQSKKRGA